MSQTYELIYVSEATSQVSSADIVDILERSRINNAAKDITGFLVFYGNEFMQILEGNEEDIKQLYGVIEQDKRHCNTRVVWEGEMPKRKFSSWDMGFKELSDVDMFKLQNYLQLDSSLDLMEVFSKALLYVPDSKQVAKILFEFMAKEILED